MADARWLDDDEQQCWVAYAFTARLLARLVERDLQHDSNLRMAYYEILMMLSEVDGRSMRMSDLAAALQVSRSRLSQAVTRLEEAGWVRRESVESDGRGAYAVLTDAGFATIEAAAPMHVESVRTHLFDLLTPTEVSQLEHISRRLLGHLIPASGLTRGSSAVNPLIDMLGGAIAEPATRA
jgi:DNA-binding MarR family transcriptional regulator